MKKKKSTLSEIFNAAVRIGMAPGKGKAVFAARDIRAGEKFGYWEGYVTEKNSQYAMHLEGAVIEPTGKLGFLNHSCEPNSEFKDKGRVLYAKKDIYRGEEVTIDYTFTEPEFTTPFECKCGAPKCKKAVGMRI